MIQLEMLKTNHLIKCSQIHAVTGTGKMNFSDASGNTERARFSALVVRPINAFYSRLNGQFPPMGAKSTVLDLDGC
jgi:hypothetical protein